MLPGALQRERGDLCADLQVRGGARTRDPEAGFGPIGLIRGAGLGAGGGVSPSVSSAPSRR